MIGSWLRALARKFLSGGSLRMTSYPARRRSAWLRLEALEDRALTSTLDSEPPGLMPAAPEAPVAVATAPQSDPTSVLSTPGKVGSLIEDVRAATPPTPELPGNLAPISPEPGGNPALSPSPPISGFGPTEADVASTGLSPSSDGVKSATDTPGIAARTEEPANRSGPQSSEGIATDPGASSTPRTRPTVVPTGDGLQVGLNDPARESLAPAPGAPGTASIPLEPPSTEKSPSSGGQGTEATVPPASRAQEPGADPRSEANLAGHDAAEVRNVADARPRRSPQARSAVLPTAPRTEESAVSPRHRPAVRADGQAVRTEALGEFPDGALLQRFVADRDQTAFTALVQRYGRFVLGVCRRVLGDTHAAQDAFQATFLVLARKASMLDKHSPLTGWLYKVAYHLSLRLRAVAARQRRQEKNAANGRSVLDASDSTLGIEQQELSQALSEELQRLPEKYRVPLVLCYFDGRTHAEAAEVIGLPRGSIAKRIGEGLERLRERMLHRGLML